MERADLRRRLIVVGVTTLVVSLLPQHAGSTAALAGALPAMATTGPGTSPGPRWVWPLSPRPTVAERFSAPTSTYGAGHRGLDLATTVGAPVQAVASGTVSHVGVINGRGTVSVLHASGVRSTYEPVAATVAVGDPIAAGDPIGTVEAVDGHCAPSTCLHLGAIRGRTYLDPLTLLTVPRIVLMPPVPG